MAQHFLKSSKVRDFTLADAANLTEDEAHRLFAKIHWKSDSQQICPFCSVIDSHYERRSRREWRCKHCFECFSVTKNTVFQDRKLPFKKIIMGMMLFIHASAGISHHELARALDIQVKTAQVLVGKIREAIYFDCADTTLFSGTTQIDGGYFGGRPRHGRVRRKPDNKDVSAYVEAKLAGNGGHRKPRSKISRDNFRRRQNRRVVMVLRELYPDKGKGAYRTVVAVSHSENEIHAMQLARAYIEPGTLIMTDENPAYNKLSLYFDHHTVEHCVEFSTLDGINDNQAESYFSRLRKYARGVSGRIQPKYLADIATEMAWREDWRRKTGLEMLTNLLSACFKRGLSRWWRGYWQGAHRAGEISLSQPLFN